MTLSAVVRLVLFASIQILISQPLGLQTSAFNTAIGALMAHLDSKRQRRSSVLHTLLQQGSLSNSGLLQILQTLNKAPEVVTDAKRHEVRAAFQERFDAIRVVATFPLTSGGTFDLEYAEPALLLSELISESPALSRVYKEALSRSSETWDLVVAFDEYTPGNKLRVDNHRKVMNLYFSFTNLGQTALSDDVAWVVPLVIRHSVLQTIEGGWPHVLKVFLQRLLLGPHGLATAGLAMLIDGESYILRAHLSCVLSDGEGIKVGFDWKGASSLHPCIKHWNVLKRGSDLAHRRQCCIEVTCPDENKFKLWKQHEIAETFGILNEAKRRVAMGRLSNAKLGELETGYGFNANPHSLWTASELAGAIKKDMVSSVRYDWCHALLQDGAFSTEVHLFLGACRPLGVSDNDLHVFLKDKAWRWPASTRAKSRFLHRVSDAYRSSSSDTANRLKCGASELLGLYNMLRHFVEVKIGCPAELAKERASFDAACQVLDVLLMTKRGIADIDTGATALQAAIGKHLELHVRAYGEGSVKPKFHWIMDVPSQIRQDRCVLDAFVIERGHLLVKSVAENIKNLSTFERSTMSGLVNAMFNRSKVTKLGNGLRGKVSYHGGIAVADHMLCSGVHISVGDVTFWGDLAGQVCTCAEDGALYLIVEELVKVAEVSPHSAQWLPSGLNAVWPAADIEQASAWYSADSGLTTVLRH